MRILSAPEAISPAFSRTKLVLFQPYKIMRTWKIGCTAYLSIIGSVFLPWPLIYLVFLPRFGVVPGSSQGMGVLLCTAAAILMLIYLGVFYLLSKLRFAFFGMVLHNEPMVAPMWRRYGEASRPWMVFKVSLGTSVFLVAFWPLMRMMRGFVHLMASLPHNSPGTPAPPQMFEALLRFYTLFFGVYFAMGLFYWIASLLSDFVVPLLALERVPLKEAFRRAGVLVRNEPRQVIGYALLKPVLVIAGFMAAMVAFYIALIGVIIIALIVGGLIGLALKLLHVPIAILMMIAIGAGLLIYLSSIIYGMGIAYGAVMTFMEAYLMYFLGGRYPLLGELLDQSTPPPAIVPPVYAYSLNPAWPPQPPPQG